MEKGRNFRVLTIKFIVIGLMLGCSLELILDRLFYAFQTGIECLLYAGPGEPGAGGIFETIFNNGYVNYPIFYTSILSFIVVGVWIGKKLNQHQLTVVRTIPVLFFLAFLTARLWSLLIVKSFRYPLSFAIASMVEHELFSLLSVIGFIILLTFSTLSLAIYKTNKQ